MFSDSGKDFKKRKDVGELCEGEHCTVDDMVIIHDETQKKWKKKVKIFRKDLDETKESILEIYSMLSSGEENMKDIEKKVSYLNQLLDARTQLIIDMQQSVLGMDKKLDETLIRLDYKKEGDKGRNGSISKLKEEENDLERRVTKVESQFERYSTVIESLNKISERVLLLEEKNKNIGITRTKEERTKEKRNENIYKIIVALVALAGFIFTVGVRWFGW